MAYARSDLYREIGGEVGLTGLIGDFVDRLLADSEFECVYGSADRQSLIEGITTLITAVMTNDVSGRSIDIHDFRSSLRTLTADQWARWSGHLTTLLCVRGVTDSTLDQFGALLRDLASMVSAPTDALRDVARRGRVPAVLNDITRETHS